MSQGRIAFLEITGQWVRQQIGGRRARAYIVVMDLFNHTQLRLAIAQWFYAINKE